MSSSTTTSPRRARRGILAVAAGLATAAVLPALALAFTPTLAPMSKAEERKLYRAERAILGPAHAREHRSQRAAARDPRVRARMRREQRRAAARIARPGLARPTPRSGRGCPRRSTWTSWASTP